MPTDGVIVVPVKSFATAKQRLAGFLSPEQRADLAASLSLDVLRVAAQVAPVVVVTHSSDVAALLGEAGAEIVLEPDASGHSAAVTRAVHALRTRPDQPMLVIPGDAPLITPGELQTLFDALEAPDTLILVPNREGEGTNGIACRVGRAIPFHYGPGSLARHQVEARNAGLSYRIVEMPGLALDIDTPVDFALLRQRGHLPAHTTRFVRSLGSTGSTLSSD